MKRPALIAGISVIAMSCAAQTSASARSRDFDRWWSSSSGWSTTTVRKATKHASHSEKDGLAKEKAASVPAGPLHIIVSIDAQRATLYADGLPISSGAISSGTPGHPTPMGVFTVIQKDRYHVSNLYDAAMPYMQRITWSGSALHEGPLPGYPASHGCVRLTSEFAQLLWRTTKLGARVIVTRPNVAPVAFESPWLASWKAKPAPAPQVGEPVVTSGVKTADAANGVPVAVAPRDNAKPLQSAAAANGQTAQPTKVSIADGHGMQADTLAEKAEPALEAAPKTVENAGPVAPAAPASIIIENKPATAPATAAKEIKRKPISVFVSLKQGKLYVRQGWLPLFETPVTIEHPEQPIGTHVYTAMGLKSDGDFRWTVVTIPSNYKRGAEPSTEHRSKRRGEQAHIENTPALPSASAALARIVIPPDIVARIAELMMPGSSLIVSDNRLSDETDESTDFIVTTPISYARN